MHTLTWNHSRKGTPMMVRGTWAQLWLRVMFVRQVHPGHPMQLDGQPV